MKKLIHQSSTIVLRLAILGLGVLILALCLSLIPGLEEAEYRPIIIGMYFATLPFYFALFQAIKLLGYIDKNRAFSKLSAEALNKIKYCAIVISIMFTLYTPFLYPIAEEEDAPGMLLFGIVVAGASIAVAVFAALMHRLLHDALKFKSENDLTI